MGTSSADSEMVQAAAQMLGLVLAGVLWLWLCSIAILVGGVLDAELDAQRSGLYTSSAHEEPLPARTGELWLPAARESGPRRLWRPRAGSAAPVEGVAAAAEEAAEPGMVPGESAGVDSDPGVASRPR